MRVSDEGRLKVKEIKTAGRNGNDERERGNIRKQGDASWNGSSTILIQHFTGTVLKYK